MNTLFNNIVSDTIHSVVVCVDFLGTHMANLVLSLKLGVTMSCLRDLPYTYSCTCLFKQKETKVETNKGFAGLNTGEPKSY